MDVKLPNGTIVQNVPEGTTKEELVQKVVSAGIATIDELYPRRDIGAEADKASREVADELSTVDKAIVGAGRGFKDVWQTTRQVFEESPLGGLSDVSAEDYQRQVAAERDTFEKGLGDSTAASAGRFVGQAAPALLAGGGVGAAAAKVGARTLPTLAIEGGVGGAIGGASTEVGEDIEDVGKGALTGGTIGAVAAPVLAAVGIGAKSLADELKSVSDHKAMLSAIKQADEDLFNAIPRNAAGDIDYTSPQLTDELVEKIQPFVDDAKKPAITEATKAAVQRFQDEIAEVRQLDNIGKMARHAWDNWGATDIGAGVLGYTVGGLPGAIGGVATKRAIQPAIDVGKNLFTKPVADATVRAPIRAVERIASTAPTTAAVGTAQLVEQNIDHPAMAPWANGLAEAAERGSTSLAATMHVLQQTDPKFQIALQKLEKDQTEEE